MRDCFVPVDLVLLLVYSHNQFLALARGSSLLSLRSLSLKLSDTRDYAPQTRVVPHCVLQLCGGVPHQSYRQEFRVQGVGFSRSILADLSRVWKNSTT